MKTIPLTQGKVAIVDDADYPSLSCYRWYAQQPRPPYTYYALRNVHVAKNKQTTRHMHRVILGLQPGDKRLTDHRDGNGLNNQRTNLRISNNSENNRNRIKQSINGSQYKGVDWQCRRSKWRSRIQVNCRPIHLGYFNSEIEAARSYNDAALKYFGEFALLNTL